MDRKEVYGLRNFAINKRRLRNRHRGKQMELTHEISEGLLVVRPKRRIDSSSAASFEEQCAALIAEGPNRVVIDFSEVHYVSSAGLRAVLIVAKKAEIAGRRAHALRAVWQCEGGDVGEWLRCFAGRLCGRGGRLGRAS